MFDNFKYKSERQVLMRNKHTKTQLFVITRFV